MPPPDVFYLRHMLDALRRIEQYVERTSREGFARDPLIQDAVIRQLSVLGEAAGKVSSAVAQAHPRIPWPDVTGIRHKLVHEYFVVDIDVVWTTASKDAPTLRPLVEDAVAEYERELGPAS